MQGYAGKKDDKESDEESDEENDRNVEFERLMKLTPIDPSVEESCELIPKAAVIKLLDPKDTPDELLAKMKLSKDVLDKIETETKEQTENSLWYTLRDGRITSSSFSKVQNATKGIQNLLKKKKEKNYEENFVKVIAEPKKQAHLEAKYEEKKKARQELKNLNDSIKDKKEKLELDDEGLQLEGKRMWQEEEWDKIQESFCNKKNREVYVDISELKENKDQIYSRLTTALDDERKQIDDLLNKVVLISAENTRKEIEDELESTTTKKDEANEKLHKLEMEIEDAAREKLQTLLQIGDCNSVCHAEAKVKPCGLFIDAKHPYLAASPDAMAICSQCGKRPVEIKCPETPYSKLKYINRDKGEYKGTLSPSSEYYAQVQGQMMITGSKEAWFFIYYHDEDDKECYSLQLVKKDEKFCKDLKSDLEYFYKNCAVHALLEQAKAWS